jgi:hypothetical protein
MIRRTGFLCKISVIALLIFMQLKLNAQIGVLTNNPDISAQLDIFSSTKGLLIPKLILTSDLTNSSPVDSPAEGLLIFNTGSAQELGFYYWSSSKWNLIKTPNIEEISGPSSSTDNAIVRFNGTSGKTIQNSDVIINDQNQISQINSINLAEFQLPTSPIEGKILVSDVSGNGSWQNAPPIDVAKNNSLVTANVSQLNFEGSTKVINEGNNQATIIFYNNNVTKDVIQLSSSSTIDLNSLTNLVSIPWNVEQQKDESSFTHSNSVNPNRIMVNTSGIYELNYMFSAINATVKRKTLRTRIRKNGSSFFNHITSYSFSYHEDDNKITHSSSSFLIELQENDYLELVVNGQTNDGPINLLANENLIFMRLIREL